MSLKRVSILITTMSLLMMFQCCNHVCICDNDDFNVEDEENDLWVEVEDDDDVGEINVFKPTHEWQTVEEGQAIPAGLHVRMSMQTGTREAKLMSDTEETIPSSEQNEVKGEDETHTLQNTSESVKEDSTEDIHPSFVFKGDQRRAHYYGHSDRRGIINKRRRVFSQREIAETLRKIDESNAKLTNIPGIAYSKPLPGDSSHMTTSNEKRSGDMMMVDHGDTQEKARNEKPMHRDLAEMMRHTKTLTRQSSTLPELLQALEELEYHVHYFENAKELNSIGGLVVVVRLLNHTHPEVKSSAAHVIGAATQSNPHVQSEVLDYGGLELLCQFIVPTEPELVQRRGLFALSALLRGKTQPQLIFMQECKGLLKLGHNFHQRTMPTQLKIITLLTDLLHEQEQLLHDSDELKSLLHNSVQEHGWCQHVPSLLNSDTQSPTEKALQAMSVLQHLCDFTSHQSRLQELKQHFEEVTRLEEDEMSLSLLRHSQDLLKNIRHRNKEL